MDSVFEKELLKIQLFRLFDLYDDRKAKEILIDCVDKDLFKTETVESKKVSQIKESSICNICESTEFYVTNATEVCRSCGALHRTIFNPTSYKVKNDEQFITRGENKLRTTINGKEVTLDIDKLNLYAMQNLTPHQKLYKQGINSIQTRLEEYSIPYNKDELDSMFAMYWNITLYYDKFKNVKPSIKSNENKRSYQCLCVYYGLQREINIYKILEAFDITLSNAEYFNKILSSIFKDTGYADILKLQLQEETVLSVSDEKISGQAQDLVVKLKDAKLFKDISKETFGATVIYVAHDIFKTPYTFTRVQNELGITNVGKLSQRYKQIVNFIKQNPRILK
jgi:hypothetical protein